MSDCKHTRIRSWQDAETKKPVPLWSCVDCGHKFEPVNLERDADAERYRWLRNNPEWLGWDSDFRPDEVEREIDAARRVK